METRRKKNLFTMTSGGFVIAVRTNSLSLTVNIAFFRAYSKAPIIHTKHWAVLAYVPVRITGTLEYLVTILKALNRCQLTTKVQTA